VIESTGRRIETPRVDELTILLDLGTRRRLAGELSRTVSFPPAGIPHWRWRQIVKGEAATLVLAELRLAAQWYPSLPRLLRLPAATDGGLQESL
jgi:hypothetical protein